METKELLALALEEKAVLQQALEKETAEKEKQAPSRGGKRKRGGRQ
jgi:hypothetical protein